jgi:hypothetical protein
LFRCDNRGCEPEPGHRAAVGRGLSPFDGEKIEAPSLGKSGIIMSTTLLIILTGGLFFLITCAAILDIARKDFGTIQAKALWAIVVALLPFVGVLVYFLFGFRRGRRPVAENPVD